MGAAFGAAYAQAGDGRVWFYGTGGDVYLVTPNGRPVNITEDVNLPELKAINLKTHTVRMVWEEGPQLLRLYVVRLVDGVATQQTDLVFDAVDGAWWPDAFKVTGHRPLSVKTLNGETAEERVTVLGCEDGHLRYVDFTTVTDDGERITSECLLGPVRDKEGFEVKLSALTWEMTGVDSALQYQLFAATDPENLGPARAYGEVPLGWSGIQRKKTRGGALWILLYASTVGATWSLGRLGASFHKAGRKRSRT